MGFLDIVTMYSAKLVEYLLAVGFLCSFVLFWRFLNPRAVAERAAAATAPGLLERVEAFLVPNDVFFHPGHAWARPEGPDLVSLGMDDFAQRLVGRIDAVALPNLGQPLRQGGRAWSVVADSVSLPMLSPVDGTVVAVNTGATPEDLRQDPYGKGWLIKVQAPRLGQNTHQLVSGGAARQWMERTSQTLRTLMSPDLGKVQADGGVPVDGMARALDPEHWPDVAKRFFLVGGAS